MLIAADLSPNVQLVGAGLDGAASVQNLQQALTGLAMAAGWPAANPGAVTGSVTPQTVRAVGAVVANLSGKISSNVRTALSMALAVASTSTSAMASAKTLIAQYAAYLQPAVLALTALYTKGAKIPSPPPPPGSPQGYPGQVAPAAASSTAPLPAGAIQARTKTGMYRVAVPAGVASGLGGPSMGFGAAYFELPSRTSQTPGAQLVSEGTLEAKTGTQPFYKKPLYIALIGTGVVVLGGGTWYLARR